MVALRLPVLVQVLTSIYFMVIIPVILRPMGEKRANVLAQAERTRMVEIMSAKQAAQQLKNTHAAAGAAGSHLAKASERSHRWGGQLSRLAMGDVSSSVSSAAQLAQAVGGGHMKSMRINEAEGGREEGEDEEEDDDDDEEEDGDGGGGGGGDGKDEADGDKKECDLEKEGGV
jgi:hypothetical protein